MSRLPLVSCLCVTRNKLSILKKAIECFQAQTYSAKELIIVKQEPPDTILLNYLKRLKDKRIFFLQAPSNAETTLGELRNFSVESCHGEYFCIWDDDDWQHKDRLKIQMTATMKGQYPASALTNLLIYNKITRQAYFSSYRLWEGTILCKRSLFSDGLRYPSIKKGEDTGFLSLVMQHSRVLPIVSTTLYVYIYHGNNTWDEDHFKRYVFHQPLSKAASRFTGKVLSKNYNVREVSDLLDSSPVVSELNHFHMYAKGPIIAA